MAYAEKFIVICDGEVVNVWAPGNVPESIYALLSSDPKIIPLTDQIPNANSIQPGWLYVDGAFVAPEQ